MTPQTKQDEAPSEDDVLLTGTLSSDDALACAVQKQIISEILKTLEQCLDSGCLTMELEQEVEAVCLKARQII
jgi:hypothetical protein